MIQLIKRISKEEREASKPCDVVIGRVVSISPLKVRISSKVTLDSDFLILTETFSKASCKTGDKVALVRSGGGQTFLILDKAVM